MIAHRLSTIRHADRILVLTNDGIVEEGKHDALVEMGCLCRSTRLTRQHLMTDMERQECHSIHVVYLPPKMRNASCWKSSHSRYRHAMDKSRCSFGFLWERFHLNMERPRRHPERKVADIRVVKAVTRLSV